jgi:hypothetical protein
MEGVDLVGLVDHGGLGLNVAFRHGRGASGKGSKEARERRKEERTKRAASRAGRQAAKTLGCLLWWGAGQEKRVFALAL